MSIPLPFNSYQPEPPPPTLPPTQHNHDPTPETTSPDQSYGLCNDLLLNGRVRTLSLAIRVGGATDSPFGQSHLQDRVYMS